ncbi:MAG: hypothetical protein GX589_10150 [Deltaproteobacteria bacterium]|nr:hypothetical protein [Deltaproteobacteria bacterium]
MLSRKYRFLGLLAVLFAIAFLIPVFLAFKFRPIFFGESEGSSSPQLKFSKAVQIVGGERYLQISAAPGQNPSVEKDFILMAWFRVAALPTEGKRFVLLQKHDYTLNFAPGYALALERRGREILPAVYWRSLKNQGRWYRFSELLLAPKDWFLLVLSFSDEGVLGLRAAIVKDSETPRMQVLGGYRLESTLIPSSQSDLIVGSIIPSRLRGYVGPFGIFSGYNLRKRFEEIFSQILEDPQNLPEALKAEEVRLWFGGVDEERGDAGQDRHIVRRGVSVKVKDLHLKKNLRKKSERKKEGGRRKLQRKQESV